MKKLNPVVVLGRVFPGIQNQHGFPGMPNSSSDDTPVPRQEELLMVDQVIALIKEHTVLPKSDENMIWLKQSTMFTILEGDSDKGRAIVCNPIRTALVLEQYDLFNGFCDPAELFDEVNSYEIEDSKRIVRTPSYTIEFTYDYSLPEDQGRFCMLRFVRDFEYVICRKSIPKEWRMAMMHDAGTQLMLNPELQHIPNALPRSLDRIEMCGDPIPESARRRLPKSHPVKYYDDKKLAVKRGRRSIEGLLRLAEDSGIDDAICLDLVHRFDWFHISKIDFPFLLNHLPRIIRSAVGPPGIRGLHHVDSFHLAFSTTYACFRCNTVSGPADSVKPVLANPKYWQKYCDVIATLEELYGDHPNAPTLIVNFLITYIGTVFILDGKINTKMYRDKVLSYIDEYLDRCGVDIDSIRSEVLHTILFPGKSLHSETEHFSANAEDQLKDDFVSSPIQIGYTAVFGKGGNIIINREWYSYLIDPPDTLGEYDKKAFSVDPFSISDYEKTIIRKNLTRLMSITDSFTVDREKLHGGERLQFAKLLLSLNSVELIRRAEKKNLTTKADMKRALNYAVRKGVNASAIPYVIYLTRK